MRLASTRQRRLRHAERAPRAFWKRGSEFFRMGFVGSSALRAHDDPPRRHPGRLLAAPDVCGNGGRLCGEPALRLSFLEWAKNILSPALTRDGDGCGSGRSGSSDLAGRTAARAGTWQRTCNVQQAPAPLRHPQDARQRSDSILFQRPDTLPETWLHDLE